MQLTTGVTSHQHDVSRRKAKQHKEEPSSSTKRDHASITTTCPTCPKPIDSKFEFDFVLQDNELVRASKKLKSLISKEDIVRVLHLPQTQACNVLGCSLSTLKRRFYDVKGDLDIEKWPQCYNDVRHLPIFSRMYPMSLQFILNTHDRSEKELDEMDMHHIVRLMSKPHVPSVACSNACTKTHQHERR